MPETPLDRSQWEKRADNSEKGNGFLGLLKRPDGRVSSEISIGVEIGGKEMEIPSIVPTLTPQELQILLSQEWENKPLPPSIIQKAIVHAQQRLHAHQPVFAQPGEELFHLHPHFERAEVPTSGFTDATIRPMASHAMTTNRYGSLLKP